MTKDEHEIGALWQRTGKRGTYFTGEVLGQRIVVFANDRKTPGSKAPDFRILKSVPQADRPAPAQNDDEIRF